MFILHSSNKTENLLEHLVIILKSSTLSSPFAEEIFLIQSQGMERWLSQQLAEHFKVWGNFCYLFPSKFINTINRRLTGVLLDAGFERHLLVWRFEALLRHADDKVFKSLQDFLRGENADLKRYQLARQLAGIFDQYQILRPDMLDKWREGDYRPESDSEIWQSALWRNVMAELGVAHRGVVWRQSIEILQRTPAGILTGILPERISVFGIHSMPPLLLAYLQALSLHCDIHLYLLNPVRNYWADMPSKRSRAELAGFEGHPLLVGLGQQGREFQQLLLEQVEFHYEPSSFEVGGIGNNLQQLQNDILENATPGLLTQPDNSMSFHACHSRFREVQVLKDQLLDVLERQPDLQLRDILVMAPDIQLYAPYINAEFHDIQHSIADRSLRISNSALDALVKFLKLSQSRLGWKSVLDLLEQSMVHASFGLSQADLGLIRYWVEDTNVRWGGSAMHKQALGLPPSRQNTWQAILERLFMGYAIGEEDGFCEDILPYANIEGSSSLALGGLNDFLQLLFKAGVELQTRKTFNEWQNALRRYAGILLAKAETSELQALHDLLAELDEIARFHQEPVSLTVLIAWMEGRIEETKSSNGFLRGQLTFCSLLPMRSIPFQVIALLGMNDGEYPKTERNPSFDLLANHHRLGDRSRRADERYQFLEVLISARRQLIMSFIGQSLRDNSEIPPSPIVGELLGILRTCYGLENQVIRHPLHAFSQGYFDNGDPRLFSYSASDHAIACNIRGENRGIGNWWRGRIELSGDEPIDINELLLFYHHPQRFFLRQRLGVNLPRLKLEPEEREPFELEGLDRYALQQEWLGEILNGNDLSLDKLQAIGLWPAGKPGELEWLRQKPEIQEFADLVASKNMGRRLPDRVIDTMLGDFRLVGKLSSVYDHGCLIFRFGKLKGGDFIAAWLKHLMINLISPQTTILLSKDKDLLFKPEIADPETLLSLVAIFLEGKQRPDVFFTEAAYCYLQQKTPETALNAVVNQLRESMEKGYEPELSRLFANANLEEILNEAFGRQCQTLLYPAWQAVHDH